MPLGTIGGTAFRDAKGDIWIMPGISGRLTNQRTGEVYAIDENNPQGLIGRPEGLTIISKAFGDTPVQIATPESSDFDKFVETAIPLGIGIMGGGALLGAAGAGAGGVAGSAGGAASTGAAALEAAQLAEMGFTAAEMAQLGLSQEAIAAGLSAAGTFTGAGGTGFDIGNAASDMVGSGWTSGYDIASGGALPANTPAWVSGFDLSGGGALPAPQSSFLGDILKNVFGGGTGGGGGSGGINWFDIAKTALQAGVSLYSGGKLADAAAEAALQQRLGAQAAIDEQRRQFDVTRGDLQPWLRGGQQGLVQIMQMLGIPFNPVTGQPMALQSPEAILRRDPEYQFQLGEGMRALERSAAATTGTLNPRAVKALQRYSQGVASNTYTNRYNRLAALSGLGQTTGQQLGTFGQNTAANVGNLLAQQGNAASAGTIGAANARAGGLEGAAGAIGQYGQNRQLDEILRRFGYGQNPQLGGL